MLQIITSALHRHHLALLPRSAVMTHHCDDHSVHCANFLSDGKHVQQGLCRVLTDPISGVYHWPPTHCRCTLEVRSMVSWGCKYTQNTPTAAKVGSYLWAFSSANTMYNFSQHELYWITHKKTMKFLSCMFKQFIMITNELLAALSLNKNYKKFMDSLSSFSYISLNIKSFLSGILVWLYQTKWR